MHHYLKAKFGPTYVNITLEGKFKDVDQLTSLTVPNHELEIMQSTGLLDHGFKKEVYEGDIVEADQRWWVVQWSHTRLCWEGRGLFGSKNFPLSDLIKATVRGNIYEDPDLLSSSSDH
jgi:hypothetical protein